ncbi:hypothetical protein ER57_17295 [Smithella sp. SCADC]|nr:hypothetical protein ER57_17295 [Smithella sp. SCADC]
MIVAIVFFIKKSLADVSLEKCSGLKDNSRSLKLRAGIHAAWQEAAVAFVWSNYFFQIRGGDEWQNLRK